LDLDDAVLAALRERGEDGVTRAMARVTRRSGGRMWRRAYARSADRSLALTRFLSANPATLETALAAQRTRQGRDRGQEQALGWLLDLMAGYQLASEHLGDRDWLIVDEGFSQRAVALFGYGYGEEDNGPLGHYLDSIPRPEVLVVVETPLEICERRLDQRGWSERVERLPASDRRRFLEGAKAVVTRVAGHLERASTRVIWVDGTTPAPDSIPGITATLNS
jgi:hypothetical protein